MKENVLKIIHNIIYERRNIMTLDKFTIKAQEAVQAAVQTAQQAGQQTIEPVHLLQGILLKGKDVTNFIFQKLGVNTQQVETLVQSELQHLPRVSGGEPYFSNTTSQVLQRAIDTAQKMGDEYVSIEPLLLALFSVNSTASRILKDAGCTEADMQKKKIQDLLPGLDIKREGSKNNVNVKILNEQHSFNMSIYRIQKSLTTFTNVLLLSDQSNSLLYKQRIESLNAQFAEYKQDLLRYQDRLDSSQKKSNENESFLNTLINALPFQFWAKNEHGVYMAQNQRDLKKRGNLFHTTDNAESISSYELEAREKGNPNSHTSYELPDGEEISEDEANVQINSGKFVSIFENMFIPILSKHSPYKVIGIKIDMTDQKRVERERNILQEQKNIHSRLEELGTLCGAFAHDYNNILGSQIGFCQLASEMLGAIQSEEMDDGIKKKVLTAGNFVAEATKAAQRGKVSLEELLNTIRGQAKSSGDVIVFAPYMIIDDVKKKLSLTLPPNISISSSKMDKSIRISGIPAALDRIISNLSNNALFAMKEMGGTLTFGLEKESLVHQLITPYAPPIPPGNYAKFTIADTGTGMDSNTLERIFSPFFTTKAPGEGLGLGLSSALRLLKEGNAYLTVQTRLGEGTIFNLYWSLYNESQGEQNVHSTDY